MVFPTRGSATKSNVPKSGFSPRMGDINVTVARISMSGLCFEGNQSMTADPKGRKRPRDPHLPRLGHTPSDGQQQVPHSKTRYTELRPIPSLRAISEGP